MVEAPTGDLVPLLVPHSPRVVDHHARMSLFLTFRSSGSPKEVVVGVVVVLGIMIGKALSRVVTLAIPPTGDEEGGLWQGWAVFLSPQEEPC